MPYAKCADCGAEFYREDDERWKIRCYDCWRSRRDADATGSTAAQVRQLRQENENLRAELSDRDEDFGKLFRYIGFLIFACHPDRLPPDRHHVAHEVMIWLNEKRSQFSRNGGRR